MYKMVSYKTLFAHSFTHSVFSCKENGYCVITLKTFTWNLLQHGLLGIHFE